MLRVKEDLKPQVWYEEAENGYQVCIRKLHNDYFRTEYIKCHNRLEAKELVQEIKDNGYTNIPKKELKADTSHSATPKNSNFSFGNDDFVNMPSIEELEEKEPEEKPKAKFEFDNENTIEDQYKHIPRYTEIPEEEIQETGVNKPKKFGDVQIGKGIL